MTRKTISTRMFMVAGAGVAALSACASGPTGPVPVEYLEGTVLTRNEIKVEKRTEFLEIDIHPEASELSGADRRKIENFVRAYKIHGAGQLIVSLPGTSANPQLAIAAAAEARMIASEYGVDFLDMAGSSHGAASGKPEPLLMAYQTYEAIGPACKSFAEIDVTDLSSNNEMPSLGCAVRNNLAAMIADPEDILGQRPLDAGDLGRRAVVLEKFRLGDKTAAERSDGESGNLSNAVKE